MITINTSLKEYLKNSLNSDKKSNCRGWGYLKNNVTPELKEILDMPEYWEENYNSGKVDFIISKLGDLDDELKRQLGSFVYVHNLKRREEDKIKKEEEIISRGYRKIYNTQKELDGVKVNLIIEVDGFTSNEFKEFSGKLVYSDHRKCLMFMPKRHTKTGRIIMNYAFIKEAS